MIHSNKLLRWFRFAAVAEGISFLVLILIAMPLKYMAGLPEAVKIVGWLHGVLFVAFLALACAIKYVFGKNLQWLAVAFMASVLPFGPFIFYKKLHAQDETGQVA